MKKANISYTDALSIIKFFNSIEASDIELDLNEWVNASKTRKSVLETFSVVEQRISSCKDQSEVDKLMEEKVSVDIYPIRNFPTRTKGHKSITIVIEHGIIEHPNTEA